MAIPTVNRTVRRWLERKFRYFRSAIRACPVALEHLPLKACAATAAAIVSPRSSAKFIEGQIFSPRFPDL